MSWFRQGQNRRTALRRSFGVLRTFSRAAIRHRIPHVEIGPRNSNRANPIRPSAKLLVHGPKNFLLICLASTPTNKSTNFAVTAVRDVVHGRKKEVERRCCVEGRPEAGYLAGKENHVSRPSYPQRWQRKRSRASRPRSSSLVNLVEHRLRGKRWHICSSWTGTTTTTIYHNDTVPLPEAERLFHNTPSSRTRFMHPAA
jgi:hypothetical protein